MTIDELITQILRITNANGMSFYTSTNMRDNPNVCHAACMWFMHNLTRHNFQTALGKLDATDKKTLYTAQEQITNGVKVPRAMVEAARKSGREITQEDLDALTYVYNYYKQPDRNVYTDRTQDAVNTIIKAMRTSADRMLISMVPASFKGPGHMICIVRHVGGIVIYDPNMGVICGQLAKTDQWGSILVMILQWYGRELDLTLAASKALN